MDSLQSHLLVASPRLPDNNFYRSVVLMIQHDEDGAFGVVLNRPTDLTVGEIWQEIADESRDSNDSIYLGGPVSGPLLAIHTEETHGESEVLPGVYVSTQKDCLDAVTRQQSSPFRIFSGYSGWGPGQLESEMDAGGWLTTPATIGYVFGDHEELWKNVAGDIGRQVMPAMKSSAGPADPGLN